MFLLFIPSRLFVDNQQYVPLELKSNNVTSLSSGLIVSNGPAAYKGLWSSEAYYLEGQQ